MEVNEIGFYQFDNLIQNRVPFVLVNLGVDLSSWYKSLYALHLENHSIKTTAEQAVALVREKNLPAHHAIVVLDQQGEISTSVAQQLESAGFINVFVVKEGVLGMQKERATL